MFRKRFDESLNTKEWIGSYHDLMPMDTGASVATTRPHITAGLPEKKTIPAICSVEGIRKDHPPSWRRHW
jgi:hypothetical protein